METEDPHSTQWSLIHRAAEGGVPEREAFAHRYEPVIRAYLLSRWRHSPLRGQIDDATQEVFLACFKEEGALHRVDPSRPGGLRGYLYGVVRNVARRLEEKRARGERQWNESHGLEQVEASGESASRVFDRAWAKSILKEAVERHAERAEAMDEEAVRRVELLRLRFQEGLPIRKIAERWGADPANLHRQYARGRREFASALRDVVRLRFSGATADIDAECVRLLDLLA